jgi:two-component system, cell cycle sensor histidine kinase DivJ
MLTLTQALKILTRMQAAAPEATADKLSEVSQLLQALNDDNDYLKKLYEEVLTSASANPTGPLKPQTSKLNPQAAALSEYYSPGATDELIAPIRQALTRPLVHAREQSKLLQSGAMGVMTSEQYEIMEGITEHLSTAIATLYAIDELAAIRMGKLEIAPLVFPVVPLLREAYNQVEGSAHARSHKIKVRYPAASLQAQGDFRRVLVILTDLLDNAIRYMPIGGTIEVAVEGLGTHILFSVEDGGIGLSDEDIDNVGHPFWRALHQPLVRQHPGTGLRLYLAKEILALQGGSLIYSGEPGVGSTFSFTLPFPG